MAPVSATPVEKARKFVGPVFQDMESPEIMRNFHSWTAMLARCFIPGQMGEQNYRVRGITVCERWFNFSAFCEDMGPRPKGTTLDRIDNDGNYEPGNCRWATKSQQARNTRVSKFHEVNGRVVNQTQLAEEVGVTPATILRRARRGVPLEDLVSSSPLLARKLSAEQVVEIRMRSANGESDCSIARAFEVSHSNVRYIRTRQTWRNL